MAFQIFYTIPFKSLRTGTVYTVNIWKDATLPSGYPLTLKGGAQPFTTQEDDGEDMFMPVRTQSGYIRIVDDGKDANGNSFDWQSLIPASAMSQKVTLTYQSGNTTVTVWQGYMQTQNFSGELYGNPQEREFPVQCGLSVLEAVNLSNPELDLRNFAYLANTVLVNSGLTFNNIYFQGGADARTWLQQRFCWRNFLVTDDEGNLQTKYSLYQMLEDMCRFWGWTARTFGQDVYFTCADDTTEQNFLVLTPAQLATLAADNTGSSSIGTIETVPTGIWLSGDIFASRENDEIVMRGPSKAVVKADCNQQSTIVEFAPKVIEDEIEYKSGLLIPGVYEWHQGDGDMVGYYITAVTDNVGLTNGADIQGRAYNTGSGFCRMQIYESKESSSPSMNDMIVIADKWKKNGTAVLQVELQTIYPMDYTGGSIILDGSLFKDMMTNFTDGNELYMNIGIGASKATAKWWYMNWIYPGGDIDGGWSSTKTDGGFPARLENGKIYVVAAWNAQRNTLYDEWYRGSLAFKSTSIPVPDTAGFFGNIYIEFYGTTGVEPFCIGNLKIDFSRDKTEIQSNVHDVRERPLLITDQRRSEMKYTAQNNNHASGEWNANCIFASDNNMEFGYGLLLGPTGGYVATVPYGNNSEHPEQHLANRVNAYWTASKRKVTTSLRYDVTAVRNISPHYTVRLDGVTYIPCSISHDWRDDVSHVSLAEK